MTDRVFTGGRGPDKSRGRRCGTALFARVRATLAAADQVACEFVHEQRQQFLVQALQREHEGIDEATCRDLAQLYVTIDRSAGGRA